MIPPIVHRVLHWLELPTRAIVMAAFVTAVLPGNAAAYPGSTDLPG